MPYKVLAVWCNSHTVIGSGNLGLHPGELGVVGMLQCRTWWVFGVVFCRQNPGRVGSELVR